MKHTRAPLSFIHFTNNSGHSAHFSDIFLIFKLSIRVCLVLWSISVMLTSNSLFFSLRFVCKIRFCVRKDVWHGLFSGQRLNYILAFVCVCLSWMLSLAVGAAWSWREDARKFMLEGQRSKKPQSTNNHRRQAGTFVPPPPTELLQLQKIHVYANISKVC